MDDLSKPSATLLQLEEDRARIQAEMAGTAGGVDPFPEAVRATRMPMVITDLTLPDNPIVFVDDSFCRLTGYSRSEIVGRNCRFLQGPEIDAASVMKIKDAIAAPRSVEVDIRNRRKDGTPFCMSMTRPVISPTSSQVSST